MVLFQTKRKVWARNALDDVIVSVNENRGEKFLRFSFDKRAKELICEESDYMLIGKDENEPNRIYFGKSDVVDGYKLTSKEKNRYGCAFSRGKDGIGDKLSFAGFYALNYDKAQDAFYIEKAGAENV